MADEVTRTIVDGMGGTGTALAHGSVMRGMVTEGLEVIITLILQISYLLFRRRR